jgi:hypothetical protein
VLDCVPRRSGHAERCLWLGGFASIRAVRIEFLFSHVFPRNGSHQLRLLLPRFNIANLHPVRNFLDFEPFGLRPPIQQMLSLW